MGTGRRWPGFFGSLIDGIVQGNRAHYAEKSNGGLVRAIGTTNEEVETFC